MTETPNTPAAPKATKAPITRKKVDMVLATGTHKLGFEVANETEVKVGRKKQDINDAHQTSIKKAVQQSFDKGATLVVTGPKSAERELVKRLRLAAADLGYGMSLGESRVDEKGVLRLPFKATVRRTRTVKPKNG